MSYFDFGGNELPTDVPSPLPAIVQPQAPIITTTTAAPPPPMMTVQQQQQQSKDLSDWRNIQLGSAPSLFDPFWMPTPSTPSTNLWPPTSSATCVYPSPYNPHPPSQSPYPWANPTNNPQWSVPSFSIGTPPPLATVGSHLNNFNSTQPPLRQQQQQQQQQHFSRPDQSNNVIDLTTNPLANTVNPSTQPTTDTFLTPPITNRGFIPVQRLPYPYPPPPQQYPSPLLPPTARPVATTTVAAATTTTTAPPPRRPVTEAELVLVPDVDVEEIIGQVEAVIPDIDIDGARRTITAMNPIPSTNDIVSHFLDNGYTKKVKKSSHNDHDRRISLKRSWSDTIDDIPKFLASYADPVTFFYDIQRKSSESYMNHSKAFLVRAFPTIDKSVLEQALQEENWHFLPTVRKLEARGGVRTNAFIQRTTIRRAVDMLDLSVDGVGRTPSASWLIKNNKFAYPIPHTPCEEFYDELRFAKNEVKIRRYLGKVSKDHDKRVKKAKKGNETLECDICCREDLLLDDMVECTVGHLYCRICVRTHIDVCFKEGKCRFVCVENFCPGEYPMRLVSQLLPPKDLERLNRRIQEENIRQAEIDGLECCPYCPYAVIVDNPDDKIFRCLNPDCMKETCRLCKELNHIPLRCDEVEKGVELEMRKFIEEHVTEAMIRKCPRCTQRFYKIEGCNKMTCSSCGLFICYVCRETINGYDHFTNNEKCTLSNQSEKIHYDEMVTAYANAKNEYLRLHPEARDMVLRYDPISHLTKPPVPPTTKPMGVV